MDQIPFSNLVFIMEQMSHLFKKPKGRRCSSGLHFVGLIWHIVSSGLYEQIYTSNAPSLPSPRYLRIVSSVITVENSITFIHGNVLKSTNKKMFEEQRKKYKTEDRRYLFGPKNRVC
uniref:Uncharacterized protein n=1 Tax=Lepeophtheirus salmonis TaxID=72036 RepID=A0A0K2VC29_LEPSM